MRIGNIDDLEKTGRSDGLISIMRSEGYTKPGKSEKRKNWWCYHKWYVICGAVLIGIACELIGNALGLWRPSPDIQIAYVGETPLPQDTVAALEKAFASMGGDFNGDGKNNRKDQPVCRQQPERRPRCRLLWYCFRNRIDR